MGVEKTVGGGVQPPQPPPPAIQTLELGYSISPHLLASFRGLLHSRRTTEEKARKKRKEKGREENGNKRGLDERKKKRKRKKGRASRGEVKILTLHYQCDKTDSVTHSVGVGACRSATCHVTSSRPTTVTSWSVTSVSALTVTSAVT